MRRLLILATLAATSSAVHAGTVMEMQTRDLANANATPMTVVTQAQDGKMRVEPDSGDALMIFRDDVIYNLNTKDKSYIAIDRAAMKRMADKINPALKQMQEQLAKMPPEQRAQMEKMMGNRMPGMGASAPQEVRKTSRTGKAAGHSCTYVEVLAGGVLEDEYCVVAPGALKGSQELIESSKKIAAMMQEMLSSLNAPWVQEMANRQPNFDKLGGIPVMARHFSNGKPAHESTLQALRSESLPAALFEIPAGYTRKEMMQ